MDRLAELAGYAQSFPGMVDEDFIAAGFSPDEVYSYRINQQAQSETARARELASMQEQRRARGQALAAQYPDYFRQGLETEPLYGIDQRMSDIKAGAELTQDPNFARRQFARFATGLGLPLSLAESALGLAELTPYGSFASGFDVAASIPQTAEYLREGEYGRAALSGAGGFLAALDVIGASLPITVPAARVVSKIDTGNVVGTGRALVDMDLEFLLGRGDPALAQGVGADVPGRPPLTFDEVEAAMKAEAPATVPAPAKPTAAELRRQANIQRFGYDPSEVVERTPTDDAGFEAYLEKVNPGMKRIAEEARPNLMMGDMYGMMPKGSEVVGSKGNVTFHRSPNGEYYATAFNPDVNEEDVIGYITDRGDGTELAVVSEMQGQGVGGELQYLFRKENPNAPTGGLTEAGESSLRRTYKRLADEGIIGGDVGFDVVRKDASSIFGEGSERVRYTDPKTGGTIEVVARSDGSASVLELEVPEDFQGQGVGQKLQQQVMEDFPMMGGQVSSKAAATTAYRLGRRPPGKPNATLDEVFAEIDEMSSVNMVSPDMQTRFGGPTAPSLPEANTPSETMARDILELRAAGRADEVTDKMMDQADDQYMFANTPLDMSQEARMARADEMFPRKGFHGTNADIDAFQGNVFSTDNPTLASTYARGMTDAQIYPLRLGSKLGDTVVEGGGANWNQLNPDEIYKNDPAVAGWLGYDEIADGSGKASTRGVERAAMYEGRSGVQFKDINDIGPGFNSGQFKNLGYTPAEEEALRLKYLQELSKPSNVDVRLSPNLVRSEFARFDPEFKGLKNLSAGVGGAAVLSSIGEDAEAGTVTETVSSIKEKYPLFSDIEVRDLRDQGVQDGRRLEFTEAYDDRYDKPLIEIFDPALQGEELEQAIIGEFLHEAPRRIPEYAKLREKLQKLKTPQQLQDDMNSYLYDVENYGENRPFEKWDEVSRKDAFIRGHAVGQWEPEYYTDEQKTLIDEMMGLIRSGANK
jgi:GNAT superfamily N-acetyltransferase